MNNRFSLVLITEADQYATLIFRTMDKDVGSDEVSFKVGACRSIDDLRIDNLVQLFIQSLLVWLTRLRNGTYEDKIRWIFKLYDLDGKGHVTQADIKTMIVAVHQLMDERVTGEGNTEMDIAAQRFFMRHGINPDELPDSGLLGGRGGVVGLTYEDFLRVCLKDEDIKEGIQALTSPEFDDDEF